MQGDLYTRNDNDRHGCFRNNDDQVLAFHHFFSGEAYASLYSIFRECLTTCYLWLARCLFIARCFLFNWQLWDTRIDLDRFDSNSALLEEKYVSFHSKWNYLLYVNTTIHALWIISMTRCLLNLVKVLQVTKNGYGLN